MKMINVIGLGYIGLPTALMLAKSGNKVVGTDYNRELVEILNRGILTFEEKGMEELFKEAQAKGISFQTEYVKTDCYIIAVPTPFLSKSKKIDPSYIVSATQSILDVCEKGSILILESTVPPGTMDQFIRPLIEERGWIIGEDIHLVHAPERIIPGNMVYELENNSRTVGVDDERIGKVVESLYKTFCKGEVILTNIRSAEMSKIIENTYRDVNIAFANELAKLCRFDQMDVYEIIRIANKHPRVNILQPGPGVGGHCISVDPWFLVGDYPTMTNLIHAARDINDSMPSFVRKRILHIMKEHKILSFEKVGLYGLTYKENVDDVRESPTLQLLDVLRENINTGIRVYDPFVKNNIVEGQVQSFDEFLDGLQMVVILVGHDHIKNHLEEISSKVVLDTRNATGLSHVEKL